MIREFVTIEDTIKILNRLVETDPKAVMSLIEARVPCSEALAGDPDVQVGFDARGEHRVGFLGIINGLFGSTEDEGYGAICANFKVQCSSDPNHEGDDSDTILDDCPVCGSSLKLGTLLNFERTQQSFNG